jgi:hypothetical protein
VDLLKAVCTGCAACIGDFAAAFWLILAERVPSAFVSVWTVMLPCLSLFVAVLVVLPVNADLVCSDTCTVCFWASEVCSGADFDAEFDGAACFGVADFPVAAEFFFINLLCNSVLSRGICVPDPLDCLAVCVTVFEVLPEAGSLDADPEVICLALDLDSPGAETLLEPDVLGSASLT